LVVREIRLIHTPDVKHRLKAAEQRLAPVRARCDTMEQALQAMAPVQVDGGGAIPEARIPFTTSPATSVSW